MEVPTATPDTKPVIIVVEATDVLLLLHVPLVVASLSVVIEPRHTVAAPVIIAGIGFTVTTAALRQPLGNEYVIPAVPKVTPVTRPVTGSTLAMVVPDDQE